MGDPSRPSSASFRLCTACCTRQRPNAGTDLGSGARVVLARVHSTPADTPFTIECAAASHMVGIGPATGDQSLDAIRGKCST
jgi:hypothetical protein